MTWSFTIIIKYYVLHMIVCALLLWLWQLSRLVDSTVATNVSNVKPFNVTVAAMPLDDRDVLAPL